VIRKAIEAKGKILVPTFAIGRTQLLLYLLAGAFKRKTLPPFPIYIDSPMAIEATGIYWRHAELFDEEGARRFAWHHCGTVRARSRASGTIRRDRGLTITTSPG
jgi:Cft2 family RNA processing exonuclease